MELSTVEAAKLLGISRTQLHRYGDAGKISYRPHGVRGRRRYDIEQLRREAKSLNLLLNEELTKQLTARN